MSSVQAGSYLPGLDGLWRLLITTRDTDRRWCSTLYAPLKRSPSVSILYSLATSHLNLDAALSHLKNFMVFDLNGFQAY